MPHLSLWGLGWLLVAGRCPAAPVAGASQLPEPREWLGLKRRHRHIPLSTRSARASQHRVCRPPCATRASAVGLHGRPARFERELVKGRPPGRGFSSLAEHSPPRTLAPCRSLARSSGTRSTLRTRFQSCRETSPSAAWRAPASFARRTRSWSTFPCSSALGPAFTHAPRASGTASWMPAAPSGGRAAVCIASSPFLAFRFELVANWSEDRPLARRPLARPRQALDRSFVCSSLSAWCLAPGMLRRA